jgi:uncharacterized protein (TIRG00374 family)
MAINFFLSYRMLIFLCLLALGIKNFEFASIENINFNWYVVALIFSQPLILLSLILFSLRHRWILEKPTLKLLVVLKAIFLSQGANLILPGRLSEVLKITYIKNFTKLNYSKGLAAIIAERFSDFILVLVLTLIVFAKFIFLFKIKLFIFFLMVFIIFFLPNNFTKKIISFLKMYKYLNFFLKVYYEIKKILNNKRIIYTLIYTFLCWAFSFVSLYVLLNIALKYHIDLQSVLRIFLLTIYGAMIPALPGSIGTYEAGAIFGLKSLGLSVGEALPLAILMHINQLFMPVLVSSYIYLTEKTGINRLYKIVVKEVSK